MTDDGTITNKILFDQIQLGRKEVREIKKNLEQLEEKMDRGFEEAHQKFQQAKEHREAIQEDLDATIRMQASHEQELAVLSGRPLPENY